MSTDDPLAQAAQELNRRIERHQRRLTIVTATAAVLAGLVGATWVIYLPGMRSFGVRGSAWAAALSFAALLLTVITAGDLLSRVGLDRRVQRWAKATASRHGVDAAELASLALPLGEAPASAAAPPARPRRRSVLLLAAGALALIAVFVGGHVAILVGLLVGVGLTGILHWYLGWRAQP